MTVPDACDAAPSLRLSSWTRSFFQRADAAGLCYATCAAVHEALHRRIWDGLQDARLRSVLRLRANELELALVLTFVGWGVYRALLPDFIPGPSEIPQSVRDTATLLFVACWIPAIQYLRADARRRRPIPFLACYGALYSLYYAFTPMLGLANVLGLGSRLSAADPRLDYVRPVNLLAAGWLLLILGYVLVPFLRIRWQARRPRRRLVVPTRTLLLFAAPLLGAGLVSEVMVWRDWWPTALRGLAELLALLMEASLVILFAFWRAGRLSRRGVAGMSVAAAAAICTMLAGGITGRLMFVLFAMGVGAWIARPRMPARYLLAAAVLVAGCVAVRGVTAAFRETVWWNSDGNASTAQRAGVMVQLLGEEIRERGIGGAVATGWRAVASRSANVDLLIDVMHRTPDEVPYWDGYTYTSLVGAVVPRFLWPDKPQKTLGQEFGHRYRYIAASDRWTSINLPVVVEFYINYSTTGLLIGMLVLGMLLRSIEDVINVPGQSILVSAAAAPLLGRLLVMECDLSLIFGGLPMQGASLCLVGVAVIWFARALARPRSPRPPWYAPTPAARRATAFASLAPRATA